jgi:hypothetical protein
MIEFDQEQFNCRHFFVPIIEGSQTVGLKCKSCPKEVREDMARSGIVIDESGKLREERNDIRRGILRGD